MNSRSLGLGLPILAVAAAAVLTVAGLGFGSTERVPRPAIEIIPVTAQHRVASATLQAAAAPDPGPSRALEPVRVEGVTGWRVIDPARLPALKAAGLRAGDVILAINGSAVGGTSTVIAAATSGGEGEIEYWRNGDRHNISLADRLVDEDD